MFSFFRLALLAYGCLLILPIYADQSLFFKQHPAPPSSAPSSSPTTPQYTPMKKPVVPAMGKPFSMPGVVGLQNGTWEGTDYLGYLSSNIGIDVEILKGKNIPATPDAKSLEDRVAKIFNSQKIIPQADVAEGPPLPFLHILIIVFQADKDKLAIFGASRLFEQIQVTRKEFVPKGFWQGITWENQDVSLSGPDQLNDQINAMVERLATAFTSRYRQYNPFPGIAPSPTEANSTQELLPQSSQASPQ